MRSFPQNSLNRIKINGVVYITEGCFNFDNNGFIKLEENFDDLNDFIENCQKVTVSRKNRFEILDLEK